MTENEQYVTDAMQQWVWSGFHTVEDIEQMIDDIVASEDDADTAALKSLAGEALRAKLRRNKAGRRSPIAIAWTGCSSICIRQASARWPRPDAGVWRTHRRSTR